MGHWRGHITKGHVHQSIAYGLIALSGLCALALVLGAEMETAELLEHARMLEASVILSNP